MQGMAGFRRFVELMRTDPAVEDAPGAKELTDVKGQIDLDDVTFRYDAAGPAVLSHVSLHVAPGKRWRWLGRRAAENPRCVS